MQADALAAIVADAIKAAVWPLIGRLAVLEARAPVPGRDGRDGENGLPGLNGEKGADGRDGIDGLGFDDLEVLHDGERAFTLRYVRGDRVKDVGTFRIPCEIYRGVWLEQSYERGDCVTWAGSEWHCNAATTTKPGEGAQAWTLKVKRGRDGRDGKA